MTYTNGIVQTFTERQDEVMTARVLRKARRRAADVSHSLSRKGAAKATAELLNEAVNKLIAMLYERDEDGVPCNVDADGKIIIALPWGSVGRPRYGLRRTEGDTLRRYVQYLETQRRPAVRLFFFEGGRWYLNAWDYPTANDALQYWRLVAVNASIWRRFSTQTAS